MQPALVAGVAIAAATILMTALRYRSLPPRINVNPGMGAMGQRMSRPAILMLPLTQVGLLVLAYAAEISAVPISEAHGNAETAAVGIDVVCGLLFAIQYWVIRCAISAGAGI